MLQKIKNNFGHSFRRLALDKLQNKYSFLYKGIVLDVGGRSRGQFRRPKEGIIKWIIIDIEEKRNPDFVMDVANMKNIETKSIDVVNAIELFEHVKEIKNGLKECYRVLKDSGAMILSVPFLHCVHADPYDYQRWTDVKWKKELKNIGFKIEEFEITGRFFTVLGNLIKEFTKAVPRLFRWFLYLFYPLLNLLVKLDNTKFVLNNNRLGKHHDGYFIVLKK